MNHPRTTFIIAVVVIVIVVSLSVAGTIFYSSSFYQNIPDFSGWTPVPSTTQTEVPSINQASTLDEILPSVTVSDILPSPEINQNCVYPLEYWIEHPELWPQQMILGTTNYSVDDIQRILSNATQNVRNNLILQLYMAYLNIFSNADGNSIEDTLDEANRWLRAYSAENQLSDEARELGVNLTNTLSEFNYGIIVPGACPPYEIPTLVFGSPQLTPVGSATATSAATATRFFVTVRPSATLTSTRTDRPDPPTNTAKPITNTPVPQPSSTPKPSPKPTQEPTSAPPENTPVPTQPPAPTDPPQPSTPTPAS